MRGWGWFPSVRHRSHDHGEGICIQGEGGVYIQGGEGVCIWRVCIWGGGEGSVYREGWVDPPMCDLNCSVQGGVPSLRTNFRTPLNLNSEVSNPKILLIFMRIPSLRTSFRTPLNLNSEVSNPKILLFSYWFFMQIGWAGLNLKSEVSYAPKLSSKVSKNSYWSWKLVLLLSHSESTHPPPPIGTGKTGSTHPTGMLPCFI